MRVKETLFWKHNNLGEKGKINAHILSYKISILEAEFSTLLHLSKTMD